MTEVDPAANHDFAEKLILEEYKAMREDQHVSWDAARTAVTRGLSGTGVLLAAALVGAGKALDLGTSSFLDLAVLVVLALLTPGLVVASALVWLGEIVRAERASLQLVRFEASLEQFPAVGKRKFGYFHAASEPDPIEGEQSASTVGIVVTFVAAGLVPFVLGGFWTEARHAWADGAFVGVLTTGALVLIVSAITCGRLSFRVIALRNTIHLEARQGLPTKS